MEGMIVYSHRNMSETRFHLGCSHALTIVVNKLAVGNRIRHDRIIDSKTSGEIVMTYEYINREREFFVPCSDVNECLEPNIVGPESDLTVDGVEWSNSTGVHGLQWYRASEE
jgi:hypothetical protein